MSSVHRSAREAWGFVVERGGIEIEGRDEGLDVALKEELRPTAETLDQALDESSVDEFCAGFFRVTESYVDMMRSVLDLFRAAQSLR